MSKETPSTTNRFHVYYKKGHHYRKNLCSSSKSKKTFKIPYANKSSAASIYTPLQKHNSSIVLHSSQPTVTPTNTEKDPNPSAPHLYINTSDATETLVIQTNTPNLSDNHHNDKDSTINNLTNNRSTNTSTNSSLSPHKLNDMEDANVICVPPPPAPALLGNTGETLANKLFAKALISTPTYKTSFPFDATVLFFNDQPHDPNLTLKLINTKEDLTKKLSTLNNGNILSPKRSILKNRHPPGCGKCKHKNKP